MQQYTPENQNDDDDYNFLAYMFESINLGNVELAKAIGEGLSNIPNFNKTNRKSNLILLTFDQNNLTDISF